MRKLPKNISEISRTASFTDETVPASLLKDHNTKKGVWGKLVVESGTIHYSVTDPDELGEYQINEGDFGVIVPEQKHHVELMTDDTVFHVEFMK